jgi:hypothetical protein
MSRQPEIEQIFEAWWELDHSVHPHRAKAETELHKLLDQVAAKCNGQFSRHQIQSALWDRYQAFRSEKRKNERLQIARSSFGKP